ADRDRYSLEKLQRIIATVPKKKQRGQLELLQTLYHNLGHFPQVIILFLAVPCAAGLTATSWQELGLSVALWAYGFGLATILGTFCWLPGRVVVPICAGVLVSAALRPPRPPGAAWDAWNTSGIAVARAVAGAAAVVLSAWALVLLVNGVARDSKSHETV